MTAQDLEHLRLLSIFHYVVGGITALFGCFPIVHLAVGIGAVTGALDVGEKFPAAFGWMFIVVAVAWMVGAWGLAAAMVLAGQNLARRSAYTFCLVVAGIECAFMPFGTVLGVFTIVVLTQPRVKRLFETRDERPLAEDGGP